MDSSPDGLLATYLNDHLAAATAGVELSRRAAGANDGTELGALLGRLGEELEQDRSTLSSVMDAVGASPDRAKQAAAWVGEKVGRLKPNGQLTGYSPLSRLVELEGLSLVMENNRVLWTTLASLTDPRLGAFDFYEQATRSTRQREELEAFRTAAAGAALTGAERPA
jgi:hypothetical protein